MKQLLASDGKRIQNSLLPGCVRALESYLSEWVAATVYVNFTPQETKTFPFSQIVDWQWTSRKEEVELKTWQLKLYCIIKSRSNPDCCSCWMCALSEDWIWCDDVYSCPRFPGFLVSGLYPVPYFCPNKRKWNFEPPGASILLWKRENLNQRFSNTRIKLVLFR